MSSDPKDDFRKRDFTDDDTSERRSSSFEEERQQTDPVKRPRKSKQEKVDQLPSSSEVRIDNILDRSILTFQRYKTDRRSLVYADERLPFITLMQAINRRAEGLARQDQNYPLMDMSALYCFGTAIKEYVSYLSNKESIVSYGDDDTDVDGNVSDSDDTAEEEE